jgi:putative ABC transport system permease protein
MFKNYLKIATRNLLKQKGYSFINVAGLATGIAACFLIFLWVRDELAYDRFHAKADRIYRALWEARFGDNEWKIPLVGVPLAEALEKEFPEVEETVRLYAGGMTLRHGDEYVREQSFVFAEESFFGVFTVDFISGNPETALRDPDAVVLTAETAQKYFSNQNPLGQTIEINDGRLLRVTGVVKSFPPQSHFHFSFLASIKTLPRFEQRQQNWGAASVYTYLVLRPEANLTALEAKLKTYIDKNVAGESFSQPGNFTRYPLQPMLDIHLRSHLQYELDPASAGNQAYVYLFSMIAFFILVLACINFVNLATARSMKRAREVGIRKVLGSYRSQLVRQFLAESLVVITVAILAALVFAELILPAFNQFTGKQLAIDFWKSPFAITVMAGLALVVTILAGAYPAFYLSSFWPVQALKGRLATHSRKDRLRQGLVAAQFCISIGLIIGTLVVRKQLEFTQNKRLGFDKDHVLIVQRAGALGDKHIAFRNRLISHPLVAGASAAQNLPGQHFDSTVFTLEQPANYENTSLTYDLVDESYVDVLKLNIIDGRNFSTAFATDSSAFIINQAAARAIGWDEPLGKRLSLGDFYQGPVVGVVEDFHFESLHHEVKPILFLFNWQRPSYLAVRLKPGNVAEGIAAVRDVWKEFVQTTPFEFSFLDQDYQKLYDGEQRMSKVFMTFSVLAIFIACLGLFGLASFTVEQRTKEVGIRKVLGASVAGIIGLLSSEFAKLVLISNLIAWPVAYFAMNKWLQEFAYRINLSIGEFLFAAALAVFIALLTVSYQAIRAALANPAEALRYE